MYQFLYYKNCSTCQKAKKYLEEKNIKYKERNIGVELLDEEEILEMIEICNFDIQQMFNYYSMAYKDLEMKVKLPTMTLEEKLRVLAKNPTLIRRPVLYNKRKKRMITGFKPKKWDEFLGGEI